MGGGSWTLRGMREEGGGEVVERSMRGAGGVNLIIMGKREDLDMHKKERIEIERGNFKLRKRVNIRNVGALYLYIYTYRYVCMCTPEYLCTVVFPYVCLLATMKDREE